MEILLLGGEGCGKSLLSKRIVDTTNLAPVELNQSESTIPTVGVELSKVEIGGRTITLREVGSSVYSRWDNYYKECSALIFVIDTSDPGNFPSSLTLLLEVLTHSEIMSKIPLLIALNKVDLAESSIFQSCTSFLNLQALAEEMNNLTIVEGTCLAPPNTLPQEVMAWIELQK